MFVIMSDQITGVLFYGCVRLNNSNRPYFDIWIFTFPLHAQINVNFSNFFMWRKSENYPKSELPVDGHY